MALTLRYGRTAAIELDISRDAVVLDRRQPLMTPVADPTAATIAALADPLEFPPLALAVTPGDRVAIPVEPGVPAAEKIVAGIVEVLVEAGVEPSDIAVLHATSADSPGLLDALPAALRSQVRLVRHDPSDRNELAFLSPSEAGDAIFFNRLLCDADVVLPVCCLRAESTLGYGGIHRGLFPTFADVEAQRRFQSPRSIEEGAKAKLRREEADEAAWRLGVLLSVQVLPGGGEQVLAVLVGESKAVTQRGLKLIRQAWAFDVPQRAALVVAAIEGSADQQSWDSLARTLHAAAAAVEEDGTIALCTEIDLPLGAGLQHLVGDDGSDRTASHVRREHSPDAEVASQLHHLLQQHRIYLLSRLDEDRVDSLGLAYVASGDEIARLCKQYETCALIGSAQFAAPHVRTLQQAQHEDR